MKRILAPVLLALSLSMSFSSFAQGEEPIISKNVTVIQNTTAAQCPSSWRGAANPVNEVADTGAGVVTGTSGATVRSCESCSFDAGTNSCICATCYDYFN